MHSVHGDIHEIGLQDDCQDCELHANDPFKSLDSIMLAQLVTLAITMRMDIKQSQPRTENEAIARAQIMNALEKAGKMFETMQLYSAADFDLLMYYFEHYWRIDFS